VTNENVEHVVASTLSDRELFVVVASICFIVKNIKFYTRIRANRLNLVEFFVLQHLQIKTNQMVQLFHVDEQLRKFSKSIKWRNVSKT